MVHIVCVDVNDNCPVLESGSMFTASIPENMAPGTLITLVLCLYTCVCVCVCVCACVCVYMYAYIYHSKLFILLNIGSINICHRCRYHYTVSNSSICTC